MRKSYAKLLFLLVFVLAIVSCTSNPLKGTTWRSIPDLDHPSDYVIIKFETKDSGTAKYIYEGLIYEIENFTYYYDNDTKSLLIKEAGYDEWWPPAEIRGNKIIGDGEVVATKVENQFIKKLKEFF